MNNENQTIIRKIQAKLQAKYWEKIQENIRKLQT